MTDPRAPFSKVSTWKAVHAPLGHHTDIIIKGIMGRGKNEAFEVATVAKQYLDRSYVDALEWTTAGSLASAQSAFGLVVKNEYGEYWILQAGALRELEDCPEYGQMLVRQSNGDSIGLMPFHVRPKLMDRLKALKKAVTEL